MGIHKDLRSGRSLQWCNPRYDPSNVVLDQLISEQAVSRFKRAEYLLANMFPEFNETKGVVSSRLTKVDYTKLSVDNGDCSHPESLFFKRDDLLPVAGSVKARGAFHEILCMAEDICLEAGLMQKEDNLIVLSSAKAQSLFETKTVAVGSTGNLGLGVGLLASSLGFRVEVHMSSDAKAWKVDRLRELGVQVIRHDGDYGEAVSAARHLASNDENVYFVDDESSPRLFYGYVTAGFELARQLENEGVHPDSKSPLFIYVPCGVGGAPGGITASLKSIYGRNVHVFFVEPTQSPAMMVALSSGLPNSKDVYDFGLSNRTVADGLAVGRASTYVARIVERQVAGIFTATDAELIAATAELFYSFGIEVEPSAAASYVGFKRIADAVSEASWLDNVGVAPEAGTHVAWFTGGALVPSSEHERIRSAAKAWRLR